MNGVLVVDKPADWTSHDVVAKCRKLLNLERIGHTGTLDPFATGVLVLLIGKATRILQFLQDDEKEYVATLRFGFETTTGDYTGSPKTDFIEPKITHEELEKVLKSFVGEICQIPPMFSAKKMSGKKLYELARKGLEVEREAIKVKIYELELLQMKSSSEAVVRVVCSAGTYVRALAEQIGKELGCGAHLTELRRTRAGKFNISQAIQISQLEKANGKVDLISMNQALSHLQEKRLNEKEISQVKNGVAIRVLDEVFNDGDFVRLTDGNELFAVGVFKKDKRAIQPKVVLV